MNTKMRRSVPPVAAAVSAAFSRRLRTSRAVALILNFSFLLCATSAVAQSAPPPPNKISQLRGDVTITSPASGQSLFWNGTKWVNRVIASGDVPTLNQNTTGSAATLTTARAIYGNNFDGSAALSQIIASTYGGTGNGFTKFSGPATSEKTKTLSNATDTILELGGSYTPTGTWTSMPLTTPKVTTAIQDANANSMLAFTATASAVDGFTFTNAATANPATVTMAATGSDSNITIALTPKGSGTVNVGSAAIATPSLQLAAGSTSTPSLRFGTDSTGWYRNASNQWSWWSGSQNNVTLVSSVFRIANDLCLAWSTSGDSTTAATVGVVAQNTSGLLFVNDGSGTTSASSLRDLKLRDIFGVQIAAGTVTSTYSLDVTAGHSWKMTTTASTNLTITPTAAGTADQEVTLIITSDATGGDVVTFASPFKPSGTMTLTASKVHTIKFISDGTNLYELCRTTGL